MGFDSETEFERVLIKELTRNGWTEVLHYPNEADLIKNWANILFQNNKGIDKLNNQPLTDGEMRQILDYIQEHHSPLALNGFINGKSVTVTRDNPNDPLHYGKEVSLIIYDRLEIAAGKSCYQIAEQPRYEHHDDILPNRRGDFMMLINGMPVIHVELKSSKVPAIQSANQISKYSHEGLFTGIFSLVQIFVAMNPEEMLYFANPGQDGVFNRDYYFHWADFNNEPINDWKQLVSVFLSIPMAHQMIGFYTVADQGDGILKVLRSYQYYAANAIRTRVAKIDWKEGNQLGGYIWHTTGSGKTLTSFKSAQLIANSGDADKVVFLVDRIELGTQSLEEYRGFAEATEEVQATEDTNVLVSKLKSDETKDTLIVTSIQKLSRVNEEQGRRRQADLEKARNKRIVIIIDECHRSTFGEMLTEIKATFPNAVFFGFSGTPIQDENKKKMSTTSDIFGDELHRYTIADGIRDKNVLGFDPYKVCTFKDRDLRKAVALEKAKAKTEKEAIEDDAKREVYQQYMNPALIKMCGHTNPDGSYTKGIEDFIPGAQYNQDKHRRKVVEDIKDNWLSLSQNGKFHALLATESIPEAIAYYRMLKEEMPVLNITSLFDPNIDNTGGQEFKEEGLVELIKDYNERFHQKFSISTHAAMKKDMALRLAHKKPYNKLKPEEQINILIVVNQMLTGFDSKWINTLYLDKLLEYEHLIQAFSRTNRLFGPEKPFGTIRYYRYPNTMERNVELAVAAYSGNRPIGLFAQPLIYNLNQVNHIFAEIKDLFNRAEIDNFERLPDNTAERGLFAKLFRSLNNYLEASKIQGFGWDKQKYDLKNHQTGKHVLIVTAINELTFKVLAKRYKELFAGSTGGGGKDDVPYDIDPYLTEIDTGQIDADYMNSRFEKYLKALRGGDATSEERKTVFEDLHKSFATLSQEEQHYANIFLHDVESGNVELQAGKAFHDYVVEYQTRDKNDQIHQVAELFGLSEEMLHDMILSFVTNENINEFNRFDRLKRTADRIKTKQYFEALEGGKILTFQINIKLDQVLRAFILKGILPRKPEIILKDGSTEYSSMAAEKKPVYCESLLIGGYKGNEQLEWIRATSFYNVRAITRRGAVKSEGYAERATRLLLYDVDNPAIYWYFELSEQIDEAGQEKMKALNYPRLKSGHNYFLYHIYKSLDCPKLDLNRLIEKFKPEHWTKGAPIYVGFTGDMNQLSREL